MNDNDDRLVGRVLTRREVFGLFGAASGAAMLVACGGSSSAKNAISKPSNSGGVTTAKTSSGAPSCVVRPAVTEVPYFVDEKLKRSDIRTDPSDGSGKQGVPLQITFNVSQLSGGQCGSLAGAMIDVWH